MTTYKELIEQNTDIPSEINDIQRGLEKELSFFGKDHTLNFKQSNLGPTPSLIITYFSDTKATAQGGILENSKITTRFMVNFLTGKNNTLNFTAEQFQLLSFKVADKPKKFRKSKGDKHKIVKNITKWFNDNKKIITQ